MKFVLYFVLKGSNLPFNKNTLIAKYVKLKDYMSLTFYTLLAAMIRIAYRLKSEAITVRIFHEA